MSEGQLFFACINFVRFCIPPLLSDTLTPCARRYGACVITGIACAGVAEAMCATADSITQCKFEATDPASDEVVLYKILQVSVTIDHTASYTVITKRHLINQES
jgi:hypothetical protein